MLLFWISSIILFIIIECMTYSLVSIWFVPGAFINVLILIFGLEPSLEAQTGIFTVCSFISLFMLRRPIWNKLKPSTTPTNSDALIGQEVMVELVMEENRYRVRIHGMDWLAVSEKNLEVGEKAIVKGIQGAKLILEKKEV